MKVIRNPKFKAAVIVQEPSDSGQSEQRFTARFQALTRSETEAFDQTTAAGSDDFLRAVLLGWDGLKDEDGTPFEFTPANLDLLLDLPHVRIALFRAYWDTTSGVRAAKRGN